MCDVGGSPGLDAGQRYNATHPLFTSLPYLVPSSPLLFSLPTLPPPSCALCVVSQAGVLEVGCGIGYWARALLQKGISVVALDRHPTCRVRCNLDGQRVEEAAGMPETARHSRKFANMYHGNVPPLTQARRLRLSRRFDLESTVYEQTNPVLCRNWQRVARARTCQARWKDDVATG